MGTLKIFAIRDSKAEAYLNPLFMPKTAQKLMSFIRGK